MESLRHDPAGFFGREESGILVISILPNRILQDCPASFFVAIIRLTLKSPILLMNWTAAGSGFFRDSHAIRKSQTKDRLFLFFSVSIFPRMLFFVVIFTSDLLTVNRWRSFQHLSASFGIFQHLSLRILL